MRKPRKEPQPDLVAELRVIQTVCEHALEGIARLDASGRFIHCNQAYAEMLGYQPHELQGLHWESIIVPEERDQMIDAYVRMLAAGKTRFEGRGRRRDGSLFHREIVMVVAQDHRNAFNGHHSFMRDITLRQEAAQALRRSRQQIRAHSQRLQHVREEERTRIAREIHDNLGQYLTGLKMELSALERKFLPDVTPRKRRVFQQRTAHLQQLLNETIDLVRKVAHDLRPALLDHLGLLAALDWQTKEFTDRTKIQANVSHAQEIVELPADTITQLFRIYQEILTNVTRHAQASRLQVSTDCRDDQFILVVRDNGRGMTPEQLNDPHSLGLLGMQERAALFHGSVRFTQGSRKGTVVTVIAPFGK